MPKKSDNMICALRNLSKDDKDDMMLKLEGSGAVVKRTPNGKYSIYLDKEDYYYFKSHGDM